MNFWIEMDLDIKEKMLQTAIDAGHLKKEFVEEMIALEKAKRAGEEDEA